ncbi:AraC family transcriptional regulator [Latilactobacillus curvatus]|uniref:AraC family transcriptional regulator n=1 Tax=Latilactobacillus curvatus TaxID=28038 RepID=UPI000FECDD83|nr:AraC family transcriptional regulator [Latilactobacillus curvatus]QAR34636.1 AraC family transcriptional regulator [Latilactobacillus curvatus]
MSYTDAKTFNPEILYAFDPWNNTIVSHPKHAHDFLEISIILEGQAYYYFDNQWQDIPAGQILIFNPGVIHAERQKENTFSHQLHIGIQNIALHGLARNFLPNPQTQVVIDEYQYKIIDQAWRLVTEINQQENDYRLLTKSIIIEMIVYILRGLEKQQTTARKPFISKTEKKQNQLVSDVIYYLENNYREDITLDQLAHENFVSTTYLSKTFKDTTNMSPINYLIQLRLENARALLKDGESTTTVKQVASAVGYQDAYHFSKLFKKYYGIPPSKIMTY